MVGQMRLTIQRGQSRRLLR